MFYWFQFAQNEEVIEVKITQFYDLLCVFNFSDDVPGFDIMKESLIFMIHDWNKVFVMKS